MERNKYISQNNNKKYLERPKAFFKPFQVSKLAIQSSFESLVVRPGK